MAQPLATMVGELRQALGAALEDTEFEPPRYELFHAANSICSQKVRAVLAQQGVRYASRLLDMFQGQNYLPTYVRLRMVGCDRLGGQLASTHTGSTSATSGGCDAAVVPTLIDWGAGDVIVDSKRICLYLDLAVPEPHKLRPARLASRIDAEMTVVDELPNYQMLMGQAPTGAETPMMRKGASGPGFSLSKVERCKRYLAECGEDPILARAYQAKLDKELQAATQLFSAEAMKEAYAKAEAACRALDEKLTRGGTTWLFGEMVTMADLFWCVELMRMKNLGADVFWQQGKLPRVAEFVAAAEALPSIRASVLDWPGAMF